MTTSKERLFFFRNSLCSWQTCCARPRTSDVGAIFVTLHLFVIRVAGNVVAPSQIGSIEYAASQFGTRLVVVLGHSNCGAVIAALKELALENTHRSPNLRAIVDRVRPAIEPILEAHKDSDTNTLTGAAVRANILASVERLAHGSLILEKLIEAGELTVVGAEYSIETGKVEFLDDKPA